MPKYDLAGNPMPEDASGSAPPNTEPAAFAPRPSVPFSPTPGSGQSPAPYAPAGTRTQKPANPIGLRIAIGFLSFAVGFFIVHVLFPRPVPAPTSFSIYTAPDSSFACDAPADWDSVTAPTGGTDGSVGGVLFQRGGAKIDITTDRIASLLANVLLHDSGAAPDNLFKSRAEVLHKKRKSWVAAMHPGYAEQAAVSSDSGMGDLRVSEFTAKASFLGGHIHGYRASMAGSDKTAEVVCSCSESDWPTLKPAFERVINSVHEVSMASPAPAQ